ASAAGGAIMQGQRGEPPGAAQATGGRGATPAAAGWPSPPLPAGPIVLDTGIQHQIRLHVTKGLNQPWSMAFLPDSSILVTERPGRLRIIRNGVLDPAPVEGLPQIQAAGLAGLMDVQLHPKFADNKLVYITYHKPAANADAGAAGRGRGGPAGTITLARGRWDGTKLVDVKDLFAAIPSGNAARIIFG